MSVRNYGIETRSAAAACATIALLSIGCSYPGAVYTSHQQFGLGIHLTTSDTAPVEMNIGYDHAVVAFAPRRGPDGAAAESTSLISKNDLQTLANPTALNSAPILQVDAALISGTAAIIASTAPGETVVVSTPGATQVVRPVGNAGDRIGVALTGDAAMLSTIQEETVDVHDRLGALPAAQTTAAYDEAAKRMSQEFRDLYEKKRAGHADQAAAVFGATTLDYVGIPADEWRRLEVYRALKLAAEEN